MPNLNDVTVTGRVVAVFPSRTFEGKKSGKYASLLITDKEGILRVMLWNEKAELIEKNVVKTGQVVRFSHGYTREDRSCKAELHLGSRSEVEVNPENLKGEDFPSIERFATKVGEIGCAARNIHVTGLVKRVFPISTFNRQDSSEGRVMRLTLADETGEAVVVAWDERAEELEKKVAVGVELRLVNARVKASSNGDLEVHADAGTYVEVSTVTQELTKIAGLSVGLGIVSVVGEVATAPVSREVTTSKGEKARLAVFELRDETGAVNVSAWRDHAEVVCGLKVGDRLRVENAYVRKGFDEKAELSTRNATSITVL